jgi:NADPH-dependent curcumin reductase CurA
MIWAEGSGPEIPAGLWSPGGEAAGPNVTEFQPGDEVFGGIDDRGTLAEYISIRQDGAILPEPAGLTFEQAASVPVAAVTALRALRDKGHLEPGQKVLVNGASGGVGTFASVARTTAGGLVRPPAWSGWRCCHLR